MNRSKDLDTIAPDDLSVEALAKSDEIVITKPALEKKRKKKKVKEVKFEQPANCKDMDQKIHNILGHTKHPFSSFLINPKILKFNEQDSDEQIFLAVRSHWITNLSWMLISFIMLFIPLLFNYFSFLHFLPAKYQFATTLFWYLITFIYAFEKFLDWYFDLFLITNTRIVDIDFNNLLNKHFAEANISMIQDISSSVRGIFGTFFNYGNVLIQTAAETNQINFTNVPNPEKIIKLLKEFQNLEITKGESHE